MKTGYNRIRMILDVIIDCYDGGLEVSSPVIRAARYFCRVILLQ